MSKYLFPHGEKIDLVLQRRRDERDKRRAKMRSLDPTSVEGLLSVRADVEYTRQGDDLELFLYGMIGEDFWGDGVSALDVARTLANHRDAKRIVARINSPGGDVFDGVAIYNALASHGAEVHTIIDGLAASAASLIFEAGDTRTMREASRLMIHRAWTYALGNQEELRVIAGILETIDESAVQLYANRSGLDADEIRKLLAGDAAADGTWFTVEQAIEKGLADAMEQTPSAQQAETFDFSQLAGLRVAALCAGFPARTNPQESIMPTDKTPGPPAGNDGTGASPLTEPQAATFDDLVEIAGDDHAFIVTQLAAKATIADASAAYLAQLKRQRDEAQQARAAAEKQCDDLRTAGTAAAAAEGVSGTPDRAAGGDKGKHEKRFVDLIKIRK